MRTVLINDGTTLQIRYNGNFIKKIVNDFGQIMQDKAFATLGITDPNLDVSDDAVVTIIAELE